MQYNEIPPGPEIALFVKSILVYESDADEKAVLPFYADGYPGMMYFESEKGLTVYPHDKQMPSFFIYGQTLEPLQLVFESSFRMIVFQFYPFILRSFFGIDPKSINDNCYNLWELQDPVIAATVAGLQGSASDRERAAAITDYLLSVFTAKQQRLDRDIREALVMISENRGQVAIADVCDSIGVNQRTFERRFAAETGLLPKQFARIIQFQSSLGQLAGNDYDKLTDIVYENGFSDQSHFIKVFKAYTGMTPKAFSKL
jgi:AraC-like DNA-binding protein